MTWFKDISNLANLATDTAAKMTELLGEKAAEKIEAIKKDYADKTGDDVTTVDVEAEVVNIAEKKDPIRPELAAHAKRWLAEAGTPVGQSKDLDFNTSTTI